MFDSAIEKEFQIIDNPLDTQTESIISLHDESHTETKITYEEDNAVSSLLYGMGLDCYSPFFSKINLKTFLYLKEKDLISLGVDISAHRKRFDSEMLRFHQHEWSSHVINKTKNNQFTSIEAVQILRNLVNQLCVITASIEFCNRYLDKIEENKNSQLTDDDKKIVANEIKQIQTASEKIKNLSANSKNLLKVFSVKNTELVMPTFIRRRFRLGKYKWLAMSIIAVIGIYYFKANSIQRIKW